MKFKLVVRLEDDGQYHLYLRNINQEQQLELATAQHMERLKADSYGYITTMVNWLEAEDPLQDMTEEFAL